MGGRSRGRAIPDPGAATIREGSDSGAGWVNAGYMTAGNIGASTQPQTQV